MHLQQGAFLIRHRVINKQRGLNAGRRGGLQSLTALVKLNVAQYSVYMPRGGLACSNTARRKRWRTSGLFTLLIKCIISLGAARVNGRCFDNVGSGCWVVLVGW